MDFYTSVRKYKDQILVRKVVDGFRCNEELDYSPTLFIPARGTDTTEWSTLLGDAVTPKTFNTMGDAQKFMDIYSNTGGMTIYGNIGFVNQWIGDNYQQGFQYDLSQVYVAKLDIETTCDEGFPDYMNPEEQITVITLHNSLTDLYYVFTNQEFGSYTPKLPNVVHHNCINERELLKAFLRCWSEDYPDVVTGWNIDFFDIPYLLCRMEKVLGKNRKDTMSPWGSITDRKVTIFNQDQVRFHIAGVAAIDYLQLYQKYAPKKQESYKLDNIAFVELGEKKLSYDEYANLHTFYEKDYDRFVDYNIHDVTLIKRLDDKMKLMDLAMTVAFNARCNFEDIFAQTKVWDTIIYNFLKERNITIPPKPPRKSFEEQKKYAGAYVKAPIPGKQEWVISLDVNSLYPSLIRQINISPETIIEGFKLAKPDSSVRSDSELDVDIDIRQQELINDFLANKIDTQEFIDADACLAASGYAFRKDIRGFLPEIIETMYAQRVAYKKQMLACKQAYVEDPTNKGLKNDISKYDNLQQAMKILLNSVYGAFGSNIFRYSDARLAESITLTGQLVIRTAESSLNRVLNRDLGTVDVDYVQAIDTDSCYVKLNPLVQKVEASGKVLTVQQKIDMLDGYTEKVLRPTLDAGFERLRKYMNHYEQQVIMKREVIAEAAIWTGKKRYAMNVWDSEGVRFKEPELKITGLDAIKSSTPLACRKKIIDAIKLMLTGTEKQVQAYIVEFKKEFKTLPVEDIACPRGISEIKKYQCETSLYKKGCPINVRGSILYNRHLDRLNLGRNYQKIFPGNKIKYVYLKMPNPIQENVIAFPNILPTEFELNNFIDYKTQFEKTFLSPTKLLLDAMNWDPIPRATLGRFIKHVQTT
jgi:DNA polymerase elongation subunit (family B)